MSASAPIPVTTATVPSADGTVVGYHTVGQGPGLIVVGGAMRAAEDYLALACGLAERYRVHVVDRRGRGLSGPQGPEYGIARECEDLLAVQAATGARVVFGHSYGGLVRPGDCYALRSIRGLGALRAGRLRPRVDPHGLDDLLPGAPRARRHAGCVRLFRASFRPRADGKGSSVVPAGCAALRLPQAPLGTALSAAAGDEPGRTRAGRCLRRPRGRLLERSPHGSCCSGAAAARRL